MSVLTIRQGHQVIMLSFTAPASMTELLEQAGCSAAKPCGGRGVCGKCTAVISGDTSLPTEAEQRCGVRLLCQTSVLGDAEIILPTALHMEQIALGKAADLDAVLPMKGEYGAAIDIGTTTIALLLYDLNSGCCIGATSMVNPQTSVAADVIGRIDAAMHHRADTLRQQVTGAIETLLTSACSHAGIHTTQVKAQVVTGNTTMLYLLTGRDPTPLSRAPFEADCFFGHEACLPSRATYLPDCLHAFVGADTTCALLACGMLDHSATSLLCDVGTNGELALWHCGRLYIASTAAGPAFEGAGISCGCGSIPGAIERVEVVDNRIICRTIGNRPAVGLCGSGLVDAVASMLETGILDESGYLEEEEYPLCDGVTLLQRDIRAVQLAKAATFAGIMSLISAAGCTVDEVESVYLAGGFGSHLNINNAARIGLIPPALAHKVKIIGNAALDGASMLLMNTHLRKKAAAIRQVTKHVRLDGNPDFAQRYVDAMMFEE